MRSSNATAADSNENDPTEVSTVYRVYTVGGGSDRNPLHRVSSRAAIGRFRGRSRMDDRLVPWLSYRDRVGGNFWGRKEGERSVVARFSIIRWLRLRFKRCPPLFLSLSQTVMGGCSLEDRSSTDPLRSFGTNRVWITVSTTIHVLLHSYSYFVRKHRAAAFPITAVRRRQVS